MIIRKDEGRIAYITGLDINTYPRPLLIKRALEDKLNIYTLKTIFGYVRSTKTLRNADVQNYEDSNDRRLTGKGIIQALPKVLGCTRIDRVDPLVATLIEASYLPYFVGVREGVVIVLNTVGGLAALGAGKRVIVDLMDFWSCDPYVVRLNPIDYYVLRRALQVWAWSKAIASVLRGLGIRNVEYIPFGIDLETFDPLKFPRDLFFERFRDVEGRVLVGYSGGMWFVDGVERIGVEKIVKAFSIAERENKDLVLVMQTSRSIIPIIKRYGVKNFVYVEPTRFNDPIRQSLLHALDIKVLTATKFIPVYLSERSTMYQFMASGGAIVAEATPGFLGVLKHMEDAYIVNFNDVNAMAKAIVELAEDKKLRNKLSEGARQKIEQKYNWKKLTQKIKNTLLSQ